MPSQSTIRVLSFITFAVFSVQAFAQSSKQVDCASGSVVITDSNTQVTVTGKCKTLNVAGDGNTIIAADVGKMSLMGNNNTIAVQSVIEVNAGGNQNTVNYAGAKPKHWFGGDNNKLQVGGANSIASAPKQKQEPNAKSVPKAPTAKTNTNTNTAASSKLPRNIDNMWFIYNSKSGGKWAVMTLKDGTLTTDVITVMERGVAASKRANPNSWATYTKAKNGEQLVAKFPKWSKARRYFTTDKSIKMSSNFKLKGCWASQGSSNMGVMGGVGSSTYSSNNFCFEKNGRFSNDSSMVISGTGGGGRSLGTSTGNKHGTYRINGNTITLSYANGQVLSTAFGSYKFDTDYVFAISIGKRMYIN